MTFTNDYNFQEAEHWPPPREKRPLWQVAVIGAGLVVLGFIAPVIVWAVTGFYIYDELRRPK